MDAEKWDEKYRQADRLWSATPNQFVAAELDDLSPGLAVDLAAGEGRNSLWLAQKGWQVTAVDFSEVAIDRGRAADKGGLVDWCVADLATYSLEPSRYDLVLLSYLQLPWPQMQAILRHASKAVRPGGTFFLIGHDRRNLEGGYGGPQSAEVLYSPMDVAAELGSLEIDRAETVERKVETDAGPRIALDCLVRARRPE